MQTESVPVTGVCEIALEMSDLEAGERFYAGLLGFDVTVRGYPGALFLSSGGYHHHIGVNTWAGPGARAQPADSRGLVWFELLVEDEAAVEELRARLEGAGVEAEAVAGGVLTRDPSGNRILIRSQAH